MLGKTPDFSTVVQVDTIKSNIEFYTIAGKNKSSVKYESVPLHNLTFDEAFFTEFATALTQYAERNTLNRSSQITLILPDNTVLQDTINIPTIGKDAMSGALKIKMEELYKNYKTLKVNTKLAVSNKQFSSYAVSAMQTALISGCNSTCSQSKVPTKTIAPAYVSTLEAVIALRPKYKGKNFLFLDIKEDYARFVFSAKDRATGSYILPFGYNTLSEEAMPQEDMLFDRSLADLLVLNAKEKAKRKALSILDDEEDVEEEVEFDDNGEVITTTLTKPKKRMGKKMPRKLPKFMQRPLPETPQGFVYENFRLFMKWALTLIQRNPNLTSQGKPEFVLVNVPEKYEFVFDLAHQEKQEMGISFVDFQSKNDKNEDITSHLELYGGLNISRANANNTF